MDWLFHQVQSNQNCQDKTSIYQVICYSVKNILYNWIKSKFEGYINKAEKFRKDV